jgi:predicted PurR-regulated permease PerM
MKGVSKDFVNKLLLITLAGIVIWNFDRVLNTVSIVKQALTPLFIGIVFALILNIPMEYFSEKVFRKLKKGRQGLSLFVSVALFAGFLTAFGFLLFPRLVESVKNVVERFQNGQAFQSPAQDGALSFIYDNLNKLLSNFVNRLGDYLPRLMKIAEDALRILLNTLLGLIFAILILNNKEQLRRQIRKVIFSIAKKEKIKNVLDTLNMALEKFSRYMGGQLIEALILGFFTYTFMLILGLPLAPLIAFITALFNLVPIIGAYIGGGISALLIFSINPSQVLIFAIFIIILQQVEAMTTYPVIVGKYVGLSSFWILAAVVVGGGLFGFWGVFLSVPITAFFARIFERGAPKEKAQDLALS